jgi:hypothetical protein
LREHHDVVDQIDHANPGGVEILKGGRLEKRLQDVGLPMKVSEVKELSTKGIITNPSQVGGYPEYKGVPYADSDKDGMSYEWEKANGLNFTDPADASTDRDAIIEALLGNLCRCTGYHNIVRAAEAGLGLRGTAPDA